MKTLLKIAVIILITLLSHTIHGQDSSANIKAVVLTTDYVKNSKSMIFKESRYISLPYYLAVNYTVGSKVEVTSESMPQAKGYYIVLDYYTTNGYVQLYLRPDIVKDISKREGLITIHNSK